MRCTAAMYCIVHGLDRLVQRRKAFHMVNAFGAGRTVSPSRPTVAGPQHPTIGGGIQELLTVLSSVALAAAAMTFPFVAQMSHVGRVDNSDGQFSIWNVAWVARSLMRDPWHVYDA